MSTGAIHCQKYLSCNQEDSPNFLMDASAVVMELGLSMQKAVLFFFHQSLFLQEKMSGIQGSFTRL